MRKTFTTADGAVLHYTDQGQGEVLLLLHGWSQSAAMFRHQVEALSARRRVIALDFRGHGESPKAASGYRIYRLAADVDALLRHERIDKESLLGWSLGASVLWAFFDLYGSARLDRLVFVDEPASVMRQPAMSDAQAVDAGALFDAATMASVAAQIAGPEGAVARANFLGSMVTKNIGPELRDWLLAENLRVDARDAAALFVDHCSIDWSDIFARIDRPTLVIGGRVSHVDVRSQQWIHAQVAGSRLVLFDAQQGGAHFPFIEAPAPFNAALEAFLDGSAA